MNAVAVGPSVVALVMMLSGLGGLPLSTPPLPEDPLMAKLAPDECLAYVSLAGVAQPDHRSTNQTEQLLAEPEVRRMLREITDSARRALGEAGGGGGDELQTLLAAEGSPIIEALLTQPVALYVSRVALAREGLDVRAGLIVRLGDDAERIQATLRKLEGLLAEKFGGEVQDVDTAGGTWRQFPVPEGIPPVRWTMKGKYLLLTVGETEPADLIARAKTPPPAWLAAMRKKLTVKRPSVTVYVDVKNIRDLVVPLAGGVEVQSTIAALGLDNVTTFQAVTGLSERGAVTKRLVGVAGERTGLLSLLPETTLTKEDLALVPRDARLACVAKFDLDAAFKKILEAAERISPDGGEAIAGMLDAEQRSVGVRVSEDLFQTLGDTWRVYDGAGHGAWPLLGLTAVVDVRDPDKLAASLKKLADFVASVEEHNRRRLTIKSLSSGERTIYFLNPVGVPIPVAPAWCVAGEQLVVGLFPQSVRSFLTRDAATGSLADVPEVAKLVAADPAPQVVGYYDSKSIFRLVYPLLQMAATAAFSEAQREGFELNPSILPSALAIERHLIPGSGSVTLTNDGVLTVQEGTGVAQGLGSAFLGTSVGLLAPAVTNSRKAATRVKSLNNLKQLALAMHIHHDARNRLPAPANYADGKPLLSWRVHLLPYLEDQQLYKQFKLDEPWDSEHNRRLVAQMPEIYKLPGSPAGEGRTPYVLPVGEGTLFDDQRGIRFRDVPDGTSNTIMIVKVHSAGSVVWTKPDDWQFDPDNPRRGLFGPQGPEIQAAFADGSVRTIVKTIDANALKAFFTRAGGEVVPAQ